MEWGKWLWYSSLGDENHVRDCVALSVIGDSTLRSSAFAVAGWAKSGSLIRYRALDLITTLFIGLGHLLVAQTIGPPAPVGPKPSAAAAPARVGSKPSAATVPAPGSSKPPVATVRAPAGPELPPATAAAAESSANGNRTLPWIIILNSPRDLDELWQKIESPDLLVIKPDQANAAGPRNGRAGDSGDRGPPPWAVQSIDVAGRVAVESADLTASITIVLKGSEPVWVPIRLDDQRVRSAREGSRELLLRMGARQEWRVQLSGPGEHRIQVEFRAPVRTDPAKKWLSVPIPEAASTRLELDFLDRESDIVVGSNEDFGLKNLGDGKPTRLLAHLSPRSKLEVSWAAGEGSGAGSSPLLTAQGEIAVDIDADQMRTRSSWMIRCVRGTTPRLEIRINDEDELTELLVDDQSTEGGVERGAGKLAFRLGDVLRPGQAKRVVMKTRRSFKNPAVQRASFSGFPVTGAKEQTGFIGVIQSPNLWVEPVLTRGARQIDPRELPTDLRARPSTNLAFEFREQPFQLDFLVEPLPPLVKADSKTSFWIDSERARSETNIDFSWVRGRLFDLELSVPASVQIVSIGPPAVVELSSMSAEEPRAVGAGALEPARRLKIRLTASARNQNKVTVKVQGLEPIPPAGLAKLGLITPLHVTSVAASYELVAESGLVVELDDESGRIRRSNEPAAHVARLAARDGLSPGVFGDGGFNALLLSSDGIVKELPVRITRHSRTVTHDTEISAQASRRSIDVIQQTTLAVHFGVLGSLEIRVPRAIADRWELIDKEIVERRELGRDPDGSRRYRLTFERPVVDKRTLQFRYRLPLVPGLDARQSREIVLPGIMVKEGTAGLTKVGLSLGAEIVLEASDPSWLRVALDQIPQANDKGPVVAFIQDAPDRASHPFSFHAAAREIVPMPPVLVPRLLIKTTLAEDGSRNRVGYWVESHATDLAFSIPAGARWLGARIDGRIVEQVDYDPAHFQYRLRFPSDLEARPALVEFEYQTSGHGSNRRLEAPRLLEGGVVLQSIWEVRVDGNHAILGVPRGWFDENQWYWDGYVSKQGPAQSGVSLRGWLVGAALTPSLSTIDDVDESHRSVFVFSRTGDAVAMAIWVVPRSWLVAVCSGATLFLGFLAIFSRARFRTIWLGLAMLGLVAGMFLQPSVLFLILQSAVIGLALTLLGLVIRSLIERSRGVPLPSRDSSLAAVRPSPDSALDRSSSIGSDDSTAIRVRTPSTMDFVPTPAAEPPVPDLPC